MGISPLEWIGNIQEAWTGTNKSYNTVDLYLAACMATVGISVLMLASSSSRGVQWTAGVLLAWRLLDIVLTGAERLFVPRPETWPSVDRVLLFVVLNVLEIVAIFAGLYLALAPSAVALTVGGALSGSVRAISCDWSLLNELAFSARPSRLLVHVEGIMGLGMVAILIGYLAGVRGSVSSSQTDVRRERRTRPRIVGRRPRRR